MSIARVLDKQSEGCAQSGKLACRSLRFSKSNMDKSQNGGESQKGIYKSQYH